MTRLNFSCRRRIDDSERLRALLARLGLPTARPANASPERMLELMKLDKKTLSDRLRLILWRGIGRAEIVDGVDAGAIATCLGRDAPAAP